VDYKPLTHEQIIDAYSKVFPTRYEPMTIDRMIRFARIIEELHGVHYGST
jgi:hypothetical protein